MRLSGSKLRIRRSLGKILAQVQRELGGIPFHERFCGSLAVSDGLLSAGGVPSIASDGDATMIALWEAVRKGWEPPAAISPEEYKTLRARRKELRESLSPLHAYVGLFCSYGGKYWAGRFPDDTRFEKPTSRFAAAKAHRDVLARIPLLNMLELRAAHVSDDPALANELCFDDPPYAGSINHWAEESHTAKSFKSKDYWEQAIEEALCGPHVVTEFNGPEVGEWSAVAVWEIPSPTSLRKHSTEVLWAPDRGVLPASEIRRMIKGLPNAIA